jgi:hypothetical protein
MKNRALPTVLASLSLTATVLVIDYQLRGIDSPAAYVVFFVVGVLSPGPLPLF